MVRKGWQNLIGIKVSPQVRRITLFTLLFLWQHVIEAMALCYGMSWDVPSRCRISMDSSACSESFVAGGCSWCNRTLFCNGLSGAQYHVLHVPCRSSDDPEQQQRIEAERARLRALVAAAVAEEAAVAEADEGAAIRAKAVAAPWTPAAATAAAAGGGGGKGAGQQDKQPILKSSKQPGGNAPAKEAAAVAAADGAHPASTSKHQQQAVTATAVAAGGSAGVPARKRQSEEGAVQGLHKKAKEEPPGKAPATAAPAAQEREADSGVVDEGPADDFFLVSMGTGKSSWATEHTGQRLQP